MNQLDLFEDPKQKQHESSAPSAGKHIVRDFRVKQQTGPKPVELTEEIEEVEETTQESERLPKLTLSFDEQARTIANELVRIYHAGGLTGADDPEAVVLAAAIRVFMFPPE